MKLSNKKTLFSSQSLAASVNSDAMDVSRAKHLVIQIKVATGDAAGTFYPSFRESDDFDFVQESALGVIKSAGSALNQRIEIPDSCCIHEMRLEYVSTSGTTGACDALAGGKDD